jgi:hypothetical protein
MQALEGAVREVQDDVVQATQAAVTQYQLQLEQAQAADEACREEVSGRNVQLCHPRWSACRRWRHARLQYQHSIVAAGVWLYCCN